MPFEAFSFSYLFGDFVAVSICSPVGMAVASMLFRTRVT